MKKKYLLLPLLVSLFVQSVAFASVGAKLSGGEDKQVTKFDLYGCTDTFDGNTLTHDCRVMSGTSAVFTGNVTIQSSLLVGGRFGASSTIGSSSNGINPSTLPYSILYKRIGNAVATETATLPAGTAGQVLAIVITGCGPSGTWTVSTTSSRLWGSMVFNAKDDMAFLQYDATLGWMPLSLNSVTLNAFSQP